MKPIRLLAVFVAWFVCVAQAFAYDGVVEKKILNLPTYTTLGGKTLKDVKVGYETYGKLNAKKDNVILICHYFSGTSHAAGKYAGEEKSTGYWNAIIGSGKAFDTDKYFVVSADILSNLNKATFPFTTGPHSIDPDTGKPYGMKFPIVTIRDFVNVQKALLDNLGIKKLVAVAGPSLGSMQSLEWGAAYPDMVERVIAVITPGLEFDPLAIARAGLWSDPILLDPKWNGGDYYGKDEPSAGLAKAMKQVTLDVYHWGWANEKFGQRWASDKNPRDSWDNKFAIEDTLDRVSEASAAGVDANAFLYIVKSAQLYRVGHGATLDEGIKRIKAKVLILPAQSDLLFFPAYGKRAAESLRKAGKAVKYAEIEGNGGHLDGVLHIDRADKLIKTFLSK